MSRRTDQTYLLREQYKDASKLNARMALHARFSANPYGWMRWLFDHLSIAPQSRVLELGAGTGKLWVENKDRIPAGWELTISDFSPGMLEDAQRNLGQIGRPFTFAIIDAQEIPFDAGSFGAVIANFMLFLVPNREKALGEIQRVLQSGGRFYTSTMGCSHMRELDELVYRFDGSASTPAGMQLSFTLETGLDELSRYFSDVVLRRYSDSLYITQAGPLVDYVLSLSTLSQMVVGKVAEFTRFVEGEIAAQGGIRISKDAGMFEARR